MVWSAALNRVAHLLGRDAPSLRVTQRCGEQFVGQSRHGPAQAPAFMVQGAEDETVDAGRVVRSPWHGMVLAMAGIIPGRSIIYNANEGEIAGPQIHREQRHTK